MADFTLDMTMMFAIHDALRRDLEHVAQIEARNEGWDLFARMLRMHHTIEDDLLWPMLRDAVAGDSDDLALLAAMEHEHAAINPLLEAIDRDLADGKAAKQARADLDAHVREHLTHEERETLPLADRTLTAEQWMDFGINSAQRVGPDSPLFWPWLLDGADETTTEHLLGLLPPPLRQTYENEWRPNYAAVDHWPATTSAP
jgi:hypothetical protein